MENINQSTTSQNPVSDFACQSSDLYPDETTKQIYQMADKIIRIFDDPTLTTHAISYATYLLYTRCLSFDVLMGKLDKPGAKAILQKLFQNTSDFDTVIPRPIGLDAISEISADKIQRSLNVKQVQVKEKKRKQSVNRDDALLGEEFTNACFIDPIRPEIKSTILYNHPDRMWIRFHTTVKNPTIPKTAIIQLKPSVGVYEVYVKKNKNIKKTIRWLFQVLETELSAVIIFCSELAHFMYDTTLFLSNYLKFTWCYMNSELIFDPRTYEEFRMMNIYIFYGILHTNTTNLTNMPKETHGGLIAHTAERPKNALNKFHEDEICYVEGSRALQTTNSGSDFGTHSTYTEVISELNLTDRSLDDDYYDGHKRLDTITPTY